MFDKIVYISDKSANIKLVDSNNIAINLMNLHLIFEDNDKKVLGEVDDLDGDLVKARFLGEIVNNKLIPGVIRKPSLDAKVRVIDKSEIPMVVGEDKDGLMKLGVSPVYNDYPVFLDVNNFFSNHFAVFGNSGSGKSCGVTRLFQNMFSDKRLFPFKSNILLFDSSGEYYNAFKNLNSIDPKYHYRFISTNESDGVGEKLRLPIWLLNANDLSLLLQVTNHSQLPIIERMLKLAMIFSQEDVDANKFKNHLIAKAIMSILYTNETSPNKRNEIFSILASCSTPEFNLEAQVEGIGYTRKFRECFLIDNNGQFSESVLLTEYVSSFINDEFDNYEPTGGVMYNLDTLEKALNFTLISEGWLRNENTYGDAVTIKVRLHSLIVGPYAKYFDVSNYISLESYLSSLLLDNNRKYQIININLDDVDDDFAKIITKIYSRLIFQFAKGLEEKASIPFHIVVEEAHRYIQNDTDRFLIGYNIFERIAKEGRKYGVILGLISQRPVELSDTVISQCSNFLIFKMNHPVDVDYIRKMVPNISDEIVEKQKTLQSGTCLAFGMAFRIPLIVRLEMPNPAPMSANCDVVNIWSGKASTVNTVSNNVENNESGFKQEVVAPQFANVKSEPNVEKPVKNDSNNSLSNLSTDQINDTLSKLITITENSANTDNNLSSVNNSNDVTSSLNEQLNTNSILNNVVDNNKETNNVVNSNPVLSPISDLILEDEKEEQENTDTFNNVDSSVDLNNLVNGSNRAGEVDASLDMSDKLDTSELKIPQNSQDIPNQVDIINNNSVINPTVDTGNNGNIGSVKVAPPVNNGEGLSSLSFLDTNIE